MAKHAESKRISGLSVVTVLSLLVSGIFLSPVANESAEAAPVTVDQLCRGTAGDGSTLDTNKDSNGYFVSDSANSQDTVSDIRIDPLFSRRMYVDPGRNFDATYIAYKVTNNSGSAQTDMTLRLDFIGSAVSPVSKEDTVRYIGDLADGASRVAYFMIKANATTDSNQKHEFRIMQGGVSGTQLTGCFTDIEGVQRSLAASANKVTGITVNASGGYKLGSTFQIAVDGTPGKVGQGNDIDGSVMALSPATQSSWPTKAIRLESVSVLVGGLGSNTDSSCTASGGSFTKDGKKSTALFSETLVIRNFGDCAKTTKQNYTATYTYRIVGFTANNPSIQPYASIGSGTQVKYTGTLPSTSTSVSLTETTTDLDVTKAFVSSAIDGSNVDLTYTITASSTSDAVFSEFIDRPDAAAVLQSATFTDANNSSAVTITDLKQDLTDSDGGYWSFQREFAVTSSVNAVLTYVVRLPIGSTDENYLNEGFVRFGDLVIGSGGNITGIDALVTSTGTVTTTTTTTAAPKSPQTISFISPGNQGVGNDVILNPTSDSGLPITLTTNDPNICTVELFDGVWTLTTVSEETCQVTANQSGDADFDAATAVTISFTVLQGQVITNTTPTFTSGTADITLSADSDLEVSLISIDTEVCTVGAASYDSGTGETTYTVTEGTTTGTCVLQADQGGDSTWGPAPTKDITIGVGNPQAIDFSGPTTTSYTSDDTSFDLVATAKAPDVNGTANDHPVSFTSSTPSVCTVQSLTDSDGLPESGMDNSGVTTVPVDIEGVGTCTITATQDGYDNDGLSQDFASAEPVTRSFTVSGNGTTPQRLVFDSVSSKTYGDSSFTATVTSKDGSNVNTGLQPTLVSTTPEVCRASSVTFASDASSVSVIIESAGDCILESAQPGDATYEAATNKTLTITIAAKQLTVSGLSATKVYDATTTLTLSGTASLSGIVSGDGSGVSLTGTPSAAYSTADVVSETVTVSGYSLSGSKAANYTLASVTASASITAKPVTISFANLTVAPTDSVVCLDELSVSGGLERSGSVSSISCSGIPPKDQNSNTEMAAGSFTVTPSSATITEDISGTATDKTSNYQITYVAGTLTVSSDEIPTITTEDIEVLYGTLQTEFTADSDPSTGKSKAKKSDNSYATGSIKHFKNGSEVTEELPAGSHVVEVRFVPGSGSGLATASVNRTVTITKRKLRVTGVTVQNKVYDGTTAASVTGTASLEAGETGHDVLSGDDVTVASTVANFGSKNVGTVSASVTGSLQGSKKDNYELVARNLNAEITARPLTLKAPVYTKLFGENDPSFTHQIESGSFATGEDESTIGGVGVSRANGETAGEYNVNVNVPSPGASTARDNYNITTNPGKLYIAKPGINIQATNGIITDDEVVCDCEVFNPGSTVTLTMFSTPTVLDTATVEPDGTCPDLIGTIPDGTEGDHTLEITGEFPTTDPITYSIQFSTADDSEPSPSPAPTSPVLVVEPPAEEDAAEEETEEVKEPKSTLKIDEGEDSEPTELEITETGVVLPEPKTTKPGFKFMGWRINGKLYQPGDIVLLEQSASAVAVWHAIAGQENLPVLADTGFDNSSLLGFGFALLGLGAMFMRVARRRA